jgi:hypothetical protein
VRTSTTEASAPEARATTGVETTLRVTRLTGVTGFDLGVGGQSDCSRLALIAVRRGAGTAFVPSQKKHRDYGDGGDHDKGYVHKALPSFRGLMT